MNGVEKIRKNVKVSKRDGKNGQAALHLIESPRLRLFCMFYH